MVTNDDMLVDLEDKMWRMLNLIMDSKRLHNDSIVQAIRDQLRQTMALYLDLSNVNSDSSSAS